MKLLSALTILVILSAAAGCAVPTEESEASQAALVTGAQLIATRLAADPATGRASGTLVRAGTLDAQRVVGGSYLQYDPQLTYGLVVANTSARQAYLVRTGFLRLYQGGLAENASAALYGSFQAPLDDEHGDGVHVSQQRFTNGYMLWLSSPSWQGVARLASEVVKQRLETSPATAGATHAFLTGYRSVLRGCQGVAATSAWVIVNPTADRAFVVRDAILEQYAPAAASLGLPIEEETTVGTTTSQPFERGALSFVMSTTGSDD